VMGMFKKRCFLLCSSIKLILLECTSDCLGCDRVGDDAINKLNSLNSIVKLSRLDLTNN
jgi:hypothetical protein